MLLPIPSIRLTWGGSLPAGDVWQCGLTVGVLASPDNTTQATMQSVANQFQARVATYMTGSGAGTLLSTGGSVTRVRAYHVPASSNAADLVAAATFTAYNGIGSGATLPNQCALVVSLRSTNPGRKGRGRFYLPALNPSVVNGRMNTPTPATVASATKTFLDGVNADLATLSAGYRLIAGTSTLPITTIVVDDIIDTQRRRRNKVIAVNTGTAALVNPV